MKLKLSKQSQADSTSTSTSASAKCSRCDQRAVYFRRYSGQHFCEEHFIKYFEDKVKKTILKKQMFANEEKIGIALSGGKDSITTLSIVHNFKPDLELCAIAIDEGIRGYRNKTLKAAKAFCSKLGVPLHIVSFKKAFGHTLDAIVKKNGLHACTFCGVFRRKLLNEKARELGLYKLATGHNLDDEVQAIMMNYIRGDIKRLIRLGTPTPGKKFVKRIKPLAEIPEKEVALYGVLKNLKISSEECPYTFSFRTSIRDFLNDLEKHNPGIKFSISKGYQKILPYLKKYDRSKVNKCRVCGELSSQSVCNACKLLSKIFI